MSGSKNHFHCLSNFSKKIILPATDSSANERVTCSRDECQIAFEIREHFNRLAQITKFIGMLY